MLGDRDKMREVLKEMKRTGDFRTKDWWPAKNQSDIAWNLAFRKILGIGFADYEVNEQMERELDKRFFYTADAEDEDDKDDLEHFDLMRKHEEKKAAFLKTGVYDDGAGDADHEDEVLNKDEDFLRRLRLGAKDSKQRRKRKPKGKTKRRVKRFNYTRYFLEMRPMDRELPPSLRTEVPWQWEMRTPETAAKLPVDTDLEMGQDNMSWARQIDTTPSGSDYLWDDPHSKKIHYIQPFNDTVKYVREVIMEGHTGSSSMEEHMKKKFPAEYGLPSRRALRDKNRERRVDEMVRLWTSSRNKGEKEEVPGSLGAFYTTIDDSEEIACRKHFRLYPEGRSDVNMSIKSDFDTSESMADINKTKLEMMYKEAIEARHRRRNESINSPNSLYSKEIKPIPWQGFYNPIQYDEDSTDNWKNHFPNNSAHFKIPQNKEEYREFLVNVSDPHWKPEEDRQWFPGLRNQDIYPKHFEALRQKSIKESFKNFCKKDYTEYTYHHPEELEKGIHKPYILRFYRSQHRIEHDRKDSRLRFILDTDPRLNALERCEACGGNTDFMLQRIPRGYCICMNPSCGRKITITDVVDEETVVISWRDVSEERRKMGIMDAWNLYKHISGRLDRIKAYEEKTGKWNQFEEQEPVIKRYFRQILKFPGALDNSGEDRCPQCGARMTCSPVQVRRGDEGISEQWSCSNCTYSYRIDP